MIEQTTASDELTLWHTQWGVASLPFVGQPMPFLGLGQRDDALNELRHLALFSHKLLVLAGPAGAGKSQLLRELQTHQDGSMALVCLKASEAMGGEVLSRHLAVELGLPVREESESETARRIQEACAKRVENGIKTVLAIDDAETLDRETLAWLGRDLGAGTDSLSLILIGREVLWVKLKDTLPEMLDQNLLGRVDLNPLSVTAVGEYLEAGLRQAGWAGEPALNKPLVQRVQEASKGWPGRVNEVAAEILLGEKHRPWAQRLGGWPLMAAAVSLSLGVAALLVFGLYQDPQESADFDVVTGSFQGVEEPDDWVSLPVPLPEALDLEALPEAGDLPSLDVSIEEEGPELVALLEAEAAAAGPEEVQESVADTPAFGVDPQIDEPEAALATTQLSDESSADPSPEEATADPADTTPSSSTRAERSRDWMATQPSDGWTVQLLGTLSRESAEAYVSKWALAAHQPFYVESTYKGKPWFVVLLGIYTDKAAARTALDSLPAVIQQQGPWLRGVKGLQ